jgi:hypothetical protein
VSQPTVKTSVGGGTVTYDVVGLGTGPLTYQWRRNGVDIAGATGASLTLTNVGTGQSGSYSVVVSNSVGSVTSNAAALTIDTTPRLINVSCRAFAGSGSDTLIMGFYIAGTGEKTLLIRGVGQKLLEYAVPVVVGDPRITIYKGSTPIESNDNWDSALASSFAAVGAFALDPGSNDSAMAITLQPGTYTVHLVNDGPVGEGLIEAYDLSRDLGTRLTNVSCRLRLNAGQTVIMGTGLIGDPVHILARNIGPGILPYLNEPASVLPDPHLRIYSGSTQIGLNDDWETSTGDYFGSAGAFAIEAGSIDAALRVMFSEGGFTVHATDATGGSGIGIVELYESP